MNQFIRQVIPFAAALILSACGSNENTETKTTQQEHKMLDHKQMDHNKINNPTSASQKITLKNDNLNAVYQHYIHLTTALTNSDAAEAKVAANAIEAGAKELKGGNKLATTASQITASADLEVQRRMYSDLSNEMIALAKKSGLSEGELYVEYCPMAMNNKGAYWMSNSKEIRNPYFGEKMMTCGEVKETIQ